MKNKNVNTVVANELCFGCGTCNVSCSVKAIHMEFSTIGRLLPQVDEDICTQCGLCISVCPGIDTNGHLSEKIEPTLIGETRQVLFGRSTNDVFFTNAQSGGVTTETLAFLFEEGRIDAALVVVQESQHAKYRVITSSQELKESQTSQYTPVDLVSGLPFLKDFKHVAIVGIPCHIEGITKLKEHFPKRYANIEYLLGLICAGTQSQLSIDVVKRIGEGLVGKISEDEHVRWRQKKFSNYQRAEIAILSPNGNVRILDNNIRHLLKQYLTAPRCNLCFDKMNLYADIVFGDAWGVGGDDVKNGGNVILCRTERGMNLIDEMIEKGRIESRPCLMEDISKGQHMSKKKQTVDKMLFIYSQHSYQLPGWAKESVFTENSKNIDNLHKAFNDYLSRSKKLSSEIVNDISRRIKRQIFIMKVRFQLRKLIKF